MKLLKFPTYNPYEIWWTTCYRSSLYSTIQFGVLQSSVMNMGPNTLKKIIIKRLKSEIRKI